MKNSFLISKMKELRVSNRDRTSGLGGFDYKIIELISELDNNEMIVRLEESEELLKNIVNSTRITFSYNYYRFIEDVIKHLDPKNIFVEDITLSSPIFHMQRETIYATAKKHEHLLLEKLGLSSNVVFEDLIKFDTRGLDLILVVNSLMANRQGRILPNQLNFDFLAKGAHKLDNDGYFITLLSDLNLTKQRSRDLYEKHSIYPHAIFSLSAGDLRPYTSAKVNIVVYGKSKPLNVFTAKITNNEDTNKRVLENYINGRNDKIISNGLHQPYEDYEVIDKFELKLDIKKQLKKMKYNTSTLAEVSFSNTRANFANYDEPNCVYISRISNIDVTINIRDLSEERIRNYYQLILDNEKCDANYLVEFLNNGIGKRIREYCTEGLANNFLDLQKLLGFEFKLPAVSTQRKIIENTNMINEIKTDLEENLKLTWDKIPNPNPMMKKLTKMRNFENFESWMDSLPFPLSSILWIYYTNRKTKDKVEYLLYFFESLAEFLTTIILSCYRRDEIFYNECLDRLKKGANVPDWYKRSTFGGWVSCYQVVSKIFREIVEGNDNERVMLLKEILGNPEEEFYHIFEKEIGRILYDASSMRNKESHGGASEERINKEKLIKLETMLNSIRSIIGYAFESSVLISPIDCTKSRGVCANAVHLLKGAKSPFIEDVILLNDILESEKVYLYHIGQNQAIELLEYIKFDQEREAFYFYSKIENNKVVWVSYHYAKEPEIITDYEGEQSKAFENNNII